MLSALGSGFSTSRISQGGSCQMKANLVGDEKPSQTLGTGRLMPQKWANQPVSGEGKERFCSWIEVSVSAPPGQNTHIQ